MRSLFSIPRLFLSAGTAVMLLVGSANTAAAGVDNQIYARLLNQYVADGVVDDKGFKSAEAELDRYPALLTAVDPAALPPADRFAIYANAGNAWTIKLILRHHPGIESIKETGSLLRSPWKKRFVKLEGRTLEDQLNDATRRFINDPDRYRLDARTLYVSKIFDWYGEDFNDDPAGYFLNYAQGNLKTRLEQQRFRLKVDYLDYDWCLNGR